MNDAETTCTPARMWLSAHRDGEADDDPALRSHLDTCHDCNQWERVLDVVNRQARLRAPLASASVSAAVRDLVGAPERRRQQTQRVGQLLLVGAAVGGIIMVILGHTGTFGHNHLGSVDGRQAEALTISLLGGFALTAWRPQRLAAGLMSVAVLAAAVTLALSISDIAADEVPLMEELSHLPILIGALGAALCTKTTAAVPTSSASPADLDGPVPSMYASPSP
jgi:hypothetical protein